MNNIMVVVTDETQTEENSGYDIDVYDNDKQDGREEECSRTGLSFEDAEEYIQSLKKKLNVVEIIRQ
jgi:hypothetical protein